MHVNTILQILELAIIAVQIYYYIRQNGAGYNLRSNTCGPIASGYSIVFDASTDRYLVITYCRVPLIRCFVFSLHTLSYSLFTSPEPLLRTSDVIRKSSSVIYSGLYFVLHHIICLLCLCH